MNRDILEGKWSIIELVLCENSATERICTDSDTEFIIEFSQSSPIDSYNSIGFEGVFIDRSENIETTYIYIPDESILIIDRSTYDKRGLFEDYFEDVYKVEPTEDLDIYYLNLRDSIDSQISHYQVVIKRK